MHQELAKPRVLNDLSLIGVKDATLQPTVSRFPSHYNPKALKYWTKALEEYTKTDDHQQNWMICTKLFLTICRSKGVDPFDSAAASGNNDDIVRWLTKHRREAIRDLNSYSLFSRVSIRAIKRTVKVSGSSFYVNNVATLKANSEDPTVARWLQEQPSPGFSLQGSKLMHKALNAATTVEVNLNVGQHETHGGTVSLTIWVPKLPRLGNSRSNLASYIEKNMWVPIVKANPFNGTKNKLF